MSRKARLGSILIVVLVLGLAAFYFLRNQGWGFDDSFITYRYADNLRRGEGLAFNPGERHYGSTAMGFAIVLAGGAKALSPLSAEYAQIHVLGQLSSAISISFIAWVACRILFRLIPSVNTALASCLAATLYVFSSPGSNVAFGHETYPFLAALGVGAYLVFFREQYVLGAVCLGVSPLLRPDCGLFLLLVLLLLASRQLIWGDVGWSNVVTVGVVFALIGAVWVGFTTVYFGTPIPETIVAKRAQVLLGHWPVVTIGLALEELHHLVPKAPAILCLLALGELVALCASSIRRPSTVSRVDRNVLVWGLTWAFFGLGLVLTYALLRVTYWPWYFVPTYFALLMAAIGAVPRLAMRRSIGAKIAMAVALLVIAVDTPRLSRVGMDWFRSRPVNQHLTSYDSIATFLRTRAPNGTTVATAEPGSLGYRLGPRYFLVDELGLVSPQVARHLIAADFDYPFRRWNPDYVIVSFTGLYSPEARWWFSRVYRLVGEFKHPYWQAELGRGAWLFERDRRYSVPPVVE